MNNTFKLKTTFTTATLERRIFHGRISKRFLNWYSPEDTDRQHAMTLRRLMFEEYNKEFGRMIQHYRKMNLPLDVHGHSKIVIFRDTEAVMNCSALAKNLEYAFRTTDKLPEVYNLATAHYQDTAWKALAYLTVCLSDGGHIMLHNHFLEEYNYAIHYISAFLYAYDIFEKDITVKTSGYPLELRDPDRFNQFLLAKFLQLVDLFYGMNTAFKTQRLISHILGDYLGLDEVNLRVYQKEDKFTYADLFFPKLADSTDSYPRLKYIYEPNPDDFEVCYRRDEEGEYDIDIYPIFVLDTGTRLKRGIDIYSDLCFISSMSVLSEVYAAMPLHHEAIFKVAFIRPLLELIQKLTAKQIEKTPLDDKDREDIEAMLNNICWSSGLRYDPALFIPTKQYLEALLEENTPRIRYEVKDPL